jgi:hypothetical protein
MHLFSFLPALTLASTVRSAPIPRQDPHVADFRTWGSTDCSTDNQGVWTFTQSDLATPCKSFAFFGASNVQSITLVDIDYENNHTCETSAILP